MNIKNNVIDLRKTNLREAPVGTEVITSKGFNFKLLNRNEQDREEWLDCTSSFIWSSAEKNRYSFDDAVEKFKDQLPTEEQFEEAESHGIREIFDDFKDKWFWSGVVDRRYDGLIYFFSGNFGRVVGDYIRSYVGGSVRCVRKHGV